MRRDLLPRKLYAFGALALAAGALAVVLLTGAPAQADYQTSQSVASARDDWKGFYYQDATKCTECHVSPVRARVPSLDLVTLTEFSVWKIHDKHAQAYAVLVGERGQKIAERLYPKKSPEEAAKEILKPEAGCLSCHGMANLKAEPGKSLDPMDGVSCTGCHGPSGGNPGWVTLHTAKEWRDKTPKQKYEAGLRDLRDPAIRAELCMSCHIGNAEEGKVVSHAMMAAGHPPLPPIEMATFSRNEPQHWRDGLDVPYFKEKEKDDKVVKNFHLEGVDFLRTRLALVGNVVAARETFKLAQDRSAFKRMGVNDSFWPELELTGDRGKIAEVGPERWPELALAHSDCFSCHHDLRYPGYRQTRGFAYHVPGLATKRLIPGRVPVRAWPLAALKLAAQHTGKADELSSLADRLNALTDASNQRQFGAPAAVSAASGELVKWCNQTIEHLRDAPFTREKARELARNLTSLYADPKAGVPDYETARQLGSLLLVVCADLGVEGKALTDLKDYLNVEPYHNRAKRAAIMMKIMREVLDRPVGRNKDFDDGMTAFEKYLATPHFGDAKTGEGLLENDFLARMERNLDNKKYTDTLVDRKKDYANDLQRLSDEEQVKVLEAVANYSPVEFKKQLEAVAKLIEKK